MRRSARAVPIVFVLVVWSLTTHGKFSDSGDEPHYLMIAESLLSDRDLDLSNNYANGDGRWFGADTLEAGPHARATRTGALWSAHDVGLPFLLVPIYGAATRASLWVPEDLLARFRQPRGLFAYSLVSLTLTLLTAAGLALVISGLARAAPPGLAAATALVVGLSPPVLSHAFLVFPETPAFFVACAFVWMCCLRSTEITPARVLLVAGAIGGLPWLHRKYSFFSIALALVVIYRHRDWLGVRSSAFRWALALAVLAPQAALHIWTLNAWGNLGGPQMLDTLPFSLAGAARGAVGLLFDRERGLAGYAPIYLLLPACWLIAGRAYRDFLAPAALLFFPMAAFAVWSAGFSPAARYLVPLVPLFVAPVAAALARPLVRKAAIPLVVFQMLISAVVWQFPRTLWPKEQGTNEALASIPIVGPAYERLLPSILTGDSIAAAWMITSLVVALTVALERASAHREVQADAAGRGEPR